MPRERVMEEAKFTNIEKGTYPVTCIGVKEDTIPNPQFGNGDVIKFTIQFDTLEDDEGNLITRETMASDYLTPGSKLTSILMAFGVTAELGKVLDIDDCVGRQALATVGEKAKTVNGQVKTYDTIESIFPAPKLRGSAASAARPAQEPAAASSAPSVVNPDGSPNHDAFWRAVKALGLNQKHVFDKAGSIDAFQEMDGADVGFLLEELKLQVEAAV